MKNKNLLASLIVGTLLLSGLYGQSLKPGTVTFQNINGNVTSQNINTGVSEELTDESLLTEGFVINTDENGYLDIVFSNGVVGRLSPNSKLEIESFIVEGGRSNRSERLKLTNARSQMQATEPVLKLKLECGDVIINATEKDQGDVFVKTPTAEVKSDIAKFFVSHGATTSESQSISRAVNLGTDIIEISSNVENEFSESNDQVSYGYYDTFAEPQTHSLYTDASAVILSSRDNNEEVQNPDTTLNTASELTADYLENQSCDRATYSLIPFDRCFHDRLGTLADHILHGGTHPLGYVLVTSTDVDSTYFNVVSGEIDNLRPGMTIPEGTIIRSSVTGKVAVVFPNGITMDVDPGSNVYLDSISTQPILSNGKIENQTNIDVRVETGRIVTNTINSPIADTFTVISPLDQHIIPSDTVVAVEFLQLDTNAFQTVSHNQTTEGSSGINTTVVSSNQLSFVSDTATFIEYAAGGDLLSFSTPPAYTHITESALIPPTYDFIDRTIAFAAGVVAGPTPIGTPGNPGNNIQPGDDEEDPVSP